MTKLHSHKMVPLVSLFIWALLDFYHVYIFPSYAWASGFVGITLHLMFIFILAKGNLWSKHMLVKKLFILYLLFAIINMFTCWYFRGQNLYESYKGWGTLFLVFYYLTFRTWKMDSKDWEAVLENMYLILLLLFALKYTFIDWEFMKLDTSEDYLEKETRVRIYSDGFLTLGFVYFLNKFLVLKKWKYAGLAFIGFFFIFMQGFRTLIVGGLIIAAIMVWRVYKLSLRMIIASILVICIGTLIVSQSQTVSTKIEELSHRNETQNFDNDDYIRLVEINYFYTQFFKNNVEMVLGAGRTQFGDEEIFNGKYPSDYSKERSYLATYYHFYPVDLGFIGLSWETGIPFAIVAICLFLYLLKIPVKKEYYYLGLYGLYMIFVGFTTSRGFYQHNLICLAIVYTIAEKVSLKKCFLS